MTATATREFGHDGHGSVRVLFDAAAAVSQVFTYSAYGEFLAIHNGAGLRTSGSAASLANPGDALTKQLYNGENLDSRTGLYNFRARWYAAGAGRFERLDPYAGNPLDPFSFHKYGFVHGDPVMGVDPSGREFSIVGISISTAIGLAIDSLLPSPSDFIIGAYQSLLAAYVINLDWDVEWALDMSLPDDWGSRLDDVWAYATIGQGLYDAFEILNWLNPLDSFGGGQDNASALAAKSGSSATHFRGAHKANFSGRSLIPHNGMTSQVDYFWHPKFGSHGRIVRYPKNVRAQEVRINPEPLPLGKRWEDLTEGEKTTMRKRDIRSATAKLKNLNGEKLPIGYEDLGQGQIEVNGVRHTWHHDYRKGNMQLVPTDLHVNSQQSDFGGTTHFGLALWHGSL